MARESEPTSLEVKPENAQGSEPEPKLELVEGRGPERDWRAPAFVQVEGTLQRVE